MPTIARRPAFQDNRSYSVCAAISISKSRSPTSRERSRNFARSQKSGDAVAIGEEISRLEAKAAQGLAEIYAKLTPWQKTQVARHPDRPHLSDYVKLLIEDFTPLAGDRKFSEDAAIIAGLGFFGGRRSRSSAIPIRVQLTLIRHAISIAVLARSLRDVFPIRYAVRLAVSKRGRFVTAHVHVTEDDSGITVRAVAGRFGAVVTGFDAR